MSPNMLSYLLVFLTTLIALTPLIKTEGIDCKGSTYCKGFYPFGGAPIVETLERCVNDTIDTQTWSNGQNIACIGGEGGVNSITGALCVWMWNTDNTTTSADVKVYYQRFKQHGCGACGNVPTVWGTNDLNNGEMSVGWSFNEGGCDGACNQVGGSDHAPGNIVPSAGGPGIGVQRRRRSRGNAVEVDDELM